MCDYHHGAMKLGRCGLKSLHRLPDLVGLVHVQVSADIEGNWIEDDQIWLYLRYGGLDLEDTFFIKSYIGVYHPDVFHPGPKMPQSRFDGVRAFIFKRENQDLTGGLLCPSWKMIVLALGHRSSP